MKTKLAIIIALILVGAPFAYAQNNDCLKDFDYLVKRIRADYPGYNDKVNDRNRAALSELEKSLRQKIKESPDSCRVFLNRYTDFFRDYHLWISPAADIADKPRPETMDVSSYGKNLIVDIDSLQAATAKDDGIEGLWIGFRQSFGVARDGARYVAVVVNRSDWKSGQVLYEFIPKGEHVFEVVNHTLIKDKKTHKTKASLHVDGKVVELHGETRFVRKSDDELLDQALLSSYEAEFPNGQNTYSVAMPLDDSTYYLRITSFYDEEDNEVVVRHWDEIVRRPNLIIDIRNNGGGQDIYYEALARLIYTKPYDSPGVEWYASKGNIKLFEDALKSGNIRDGEENVRWTQDLVKEMKKNVGGYVVHPISKDDDEVQEYDTVYAMPRHVGIIINEGNGSSAEEFLLCAKESDKVVLFGNSNTAGVLDYSNVTSSLLPSKQYRLWCPMTRSKRLPYNPIDNIGIAPDVLIPYPATEQLYDRLDSWVYFVKSYLSLLDERK